MLFRSPPGHFRRQLLPASSRPVGHSTDQASSQPVVGEASSRPADGEASSRLANTSTVQTSSQPVVSQISAQPMNASTRKRPTDAPDRPSKKLAVNPPAPDPGDSPSDAAGVLTSTAKSGQVAMRNNNTAVHSKLQPHEPKVSTQPSRQAGSVQAPPPSSAHRKSSSTGSDPLT